MTVEENNTQTTQASEQTAALQTEIAAQTAVSPEVSTTQGEISTETSTTQGAMPSETPSGSQDGATQPEPVKHQGQVSASGKPFIRAAAPALSSQSIAIKETMSRPQVPVTPQPLGPQEEPPPHPVAQMVQGENWWAAVTKKMLILGVLAAAGVVISMWALGIILGSTGLEEFVERNFWWVVFPIFALVMMVLISLEKIKEKKAVAESVPSAVVAKSDYQIMRESEEAYKERMQAVRHYQDRVGEDGQTAKAAAQTLPPQPVPPQPSDSLSKQESNPTLPEPAPEQEPQAPRPPIEFTHQSSNALPITPDGGSFFPQGAVKLQSTKPSRDDDE